MATEAKGRATAHRKVSTLYSEWLFVPQDEGTRKWLPCTGSLVGLRVLLGVVSICSHLHFQNRTRQCSPESFTEETPRGERAWKPVRSDHRHTGAGAGSTPPARVLQHLPGPYTTHPSPTLPTGVYTTCQGPTLTHWGLSHPPGSTSPAWVYTAHPGPIPPAWVLYHLPESILPTGVYITHPGLDPPPRSTPPTRVYTTCLGPHLPLEVYTVAPRSTPPTWGYTTQPGLYHPLGSTLRTGV